MALGEQIKPEEQVMEITPSAVSVIQKLLEERNIPDYSLRVFVQGGGCSGMQYGMAFEETPQSYDTVISTDGVSVIVDPTSMMYLKGATVDFVDSLMGGGFRIENPNAVSSCGCGSSFKTAADAATDGGAADCGSCSH